MKRGDAEAARRRARRQRIAFEAARLMATHKLQDSREAARRAAQALGEDAAQLPEHGEVIEQLRDYQRLFRRDSQPGALRARREAALEAMQFLSGFGPLLHGAVLDGTADEGAPVLLQVFSEDPDAFARFMLEQRWPQRLQTASTRLRVRRDGHQDFSSWRFVAEGIDFEVVALPPALQRQAPLGPDGRPMARANATQLRQLMGSESTFRGDDASNED
jgi:hypothetical protein